MCEHDGKKIGIGGRFVDSFASSMFNFDLDITNAGGETLANAFLDPFLGAQQLIQRVVVTAGGNIIEDTTNYPMCLKLMIALYGHEIFCNFNGLIDPRIKIDRQLQEFSGGAAIQCARSMLCVRRIFDC